MPWGTAGRRSGAAGFSPGGKRDGSSEAEGKRGMGAGKAAGLGSAFRKGVEAGTGCRVASRSHPVDAAALEGQGIASRGLQGL